MANELALHSPALNTEERCYRLTAQHWITAGKWLCIGYDKLKSIMRGLKGVSLDTGNQINKEAGLYVCLTTTWSVEFNKCIVYIQIKRCNVNSLILIHNWL